MKCCDCLFSWWQKSAPTSGAINGDDVKSGASPDERTPLFLTNAIESDDVESDDVESDDVESDDVESDDVESDDELFQNKTSKETLGERVLKKHLEPFLSNHAINTEKLKIDEIIKSANDKEDKDYVISKMLLMVIFRHISPEKIKINDRPIIPYDRPIIPYIISNWRNIEFRNLLCTLDI